MIPEELVIAMALLVVLAGCETSIDKAQITCMNQSVFKGPCAVQECIYTHAAASSGNPDHVTRTQISYLECKIAEQGGRTK